MIISFFPEVVLGDLLHYTRIIVCMFGEMERELVTD